MTLPPIGTYVLQAVATLSKMMKGHTYSVSLGTGTADQNLCTPMESVTILQ